LRVGLPFLSFIGPFIPPILAQNDFLLAAALGDFFACLADTGGFNVPPVCLLYEARPLAFNPPLGFLPFLTLPCCAFCHYFFLFLFFFLVFFLGVSRPLGKIFVPILGPDIYILPLKTIT